MSATLSRLQFLRGDWKGKSQFIRPPGSQSEDHFMRHCTGCRECITTCPLSVIKADKKRYPYLDFSNTECDFCAACAAICPTEALTAFGEGIAPDSWTWRVQLHDHCLTQNNVICRSCAEICEREAIHFRLQLGGVAQVTLDSSACNGCGACLSICPVNALRLTEQPHV